jgi:hypothetical protein
MKRLHDFLKKHPVIGLDTSLFIYHLEDDPRYAPLTEVIFTRPHFQTLLLLNWALRLPEKLLI